jgi:integrase/recombinase XerD
MSDTSLLGPWVRRFLVEHLISDRNLALNTQRSYRDTLRQLLPIIARSAHKRIDALRVEDLSADRTRRFLRDLEENYGRSIATRNQRLAAIHSLSQFIGLHSPEHVQWLGEIRAIVMKKGPRPAIAYLEKDEMHALLAMPDMSTNQGRRDHAVLLFLYNTGARADETAHVQVSDLDLGHTLGRDASSVLIHGKGDKERRCPLWTKTVNELLPLIEGCPPSHNVFRNRRGQPLTRFGVYALVERYAARAASKRPSVGKKRVSPHTIRHTTAMHLLRAGVDINTIRAWLGHVSLDTTNIYAEADLEMKAKALTQCEVVEGDGTARQRWRDDKGLMKFLRTL